MEEITGSFLLGIVRAIFFLIRWLIVEALLEFSFYWIGRVTLLMFTLGHYPKGEKTKTDKEKIICFGLLIGVVIVIAGIYVGRS
ncbi:hypothetical protein [Thalassomonas actiniarum]|uniref:Uncharacterized protein n=1 Tax=Thalassomonas actiniarum TaxID=485447 RepID=A0AAE9YJR4_9GAMM|nr:hypothetical protein [Thalassomonas actiniarum]WDD97070.1 hypothetical protein SG35_017105 [Thalassomonas actiniarum]